jgi:hypothetical protein
MTITSDALHRLDPSLRLQPPNAKRPIFRYTSWNANIHRIERDDIQLSDPKSFSFSWQLAKYMKSINYARRQPGTLDPVGCSREAELQNTITGNSGWVVTGTNCRSDGRVRPRQSAWTATSST